jgi:hypothetical protein
MSKQLLLVRGNRTRAKELPMTNQTTINIVISQPLILEPYPNRGKIQTRKKETRIKRL